MVERTSPGKDGGLSTQTAPKLSDKGYQASGVSLLIKTLLCTKERVNVSNRCERAAEWNSCLIKRVLLGYLEWGKGESPMPVRTIKAIRAIKAQLTQLPFAVVDITCCVFQQAELTVLDDT